MRRDRPVPPLVLAVERILSDEEREGGHTARSLATLIVSRVLLDLKGNGPEILRELGAQHDELQSEHL